MEPSLVITNNSKEVKPGNVFVAIAGNQIDGHQYIKKAINSGAAYIVAEKYPEELGEKSATLLSQYDDNAPTIATFQVHCAERDVIWDVVKNSRLAYSKWSQQAYPKQPEHLVAVTGTNGKTSTTWFYQQILALLGYGSACIGTIGLISNINIDNSSTGASLTTPDALGLHKMLENLANAGIEYAAMEASSHALDQYRLSSASLSAAAFTNFTQDHLDYHGSMEDYLVAKIRLFSELLPWGGTAVLNNAIEQFPRLLHICNSRGHNIITYGTDGADISYTKIDSDIIDLKIMGKKYVTRFNVVGDFQKYNLMAAIGLLLAVGVDPVEIVKTIPQLHAPRGRMEMVGSYHQASVFVDYAHTPDALQRALEAIRSATKGRVHLLFGCGGDRDKQKRSLMGRIAAEYADMVVVTDDNPRFEDPKAIRKEIIQSCLNAVEVAERDQAIKFALDRLLPGDALLIAGKGHEEYQIIGADTIPFSDCQHVLNCIGGENE